MSKAVESARIMVVDDDPGMLRAVSRVLGARHEVLSASAPSEALEQVLAFQPDVAVLDVRMPEMDGFELMQALREKREDLDFILMTGSVAEPDAHLIRAIDAGAFYFIQKPFDRRVLQTLVARCLELRRLRREKQRHVVRLERELEEARRFQTSLLPPARAVLGGVAIAARSIASHELGGDLYDYAGTDDGRIAVLVADVAGHGASAAMMTGIVKSAFQAAAAEDFAPGAVVQRVSDAMRAFDARRFVTLLVARIDPAAGLVSYVNAGHPSGLLHAPGAAVRRLESTGPLVSSGFAGLPWEEETARLDPDDRLVLCTDGILEAPGTDGQYGSERLEAALVGGTARGPELIDDLLADLRTFTGPRPWSDDVTMLTVERS